MTEYPQYDAEDALERALEHTVNQRYQAARAEAQAATHLLLAAQLEEAHEEEHDDDG